MKKFSLLLMAMLLTMVGCGNGNTDSPAEPTTPPLEATIATTESATVTEPEEKELTEEEVRAILDKAFANTGSYKANRILTDWLYAHDRSESAFDLDIVCNIDILHDAKTNSTYATGTYVNSVIDPWTGTTTSLSEEGYYIPDGSLITSYELLFDNENWIKFSYDKDEYNISTYYADQSLCYLTSETETEYIIESNLHYSDIMEYVCDYSIRENLEIPIVYTIDKKTNTLKHIQWRFEHISASDRIIEMNMAITPMEDINIVVPEEIKANCLDGTV